MIVNKELGITEEDVKNCTDEQLLKEWKISLTAQSGKVKHKLLTMKIDRQNGHYVDPENYKATVGYRQVLGIMMLKVQARQSELKQINKGRRMETFDSVLVKVFKEILPKETFDQAIIITKDRLVDKF